MRLEPVGEAQEQRLGPRMPPKPCSHRRRHSASGRIEGEKRVMYKQIAVVLTLLVGAGIADAGTDVKVKEQAKKGVQDMVEALAKGDVNAYVNLNHESAVNKAG